MRGIKNFPARTHDVPDCREKDRTIPLSAQNSGTSKQNGWCKRNEWENLEDFEERERERGQGTELCRSLKSVLWVPVPESLFPTWSLHCWPLGESLPSLRLRVEVLDSLQCWRVFHTPYTKLTREQCRVITFLTFCRHICKLNPTHTPVPDTSIQKEYVYTISSASTIWTQLGL